MASMSDEENIHQEETGRRTRSGRKVTAPTTPAQARTPRRSNRRQTTDQMNEVATDSRIKPVGEDTFLQSEIIQEMLAEAAQGVLVHSTESEDLVTTTMPATYETDIINDNEDVHEDVQEEIITNMEMVEQEVDGEEIVFVTETQETDDIIMETQGSEYVVLTSQEEEEEEMYANTQESDGNYIQVTGTEEVILQSQGTEGVVPHTQEMEKIIIHRQEQEQEPEEIIINTQEPEENITQTEDDKSSSFPFGNIPASENSDGKTEEIVVSNITDCVDSSLLASLVGDNANSLPSAGEESQSKDNFENTESTKDTGMKLTLETDDTHSQPAIAEDLQNGGDGESERTGADVDAEMVSEDEFPTRVQPKVTDAEEVSDDELPAPTRAELPADTEVVSEDELPSSTKKELNKRKASEGYDPGSPTEESVEVPEKKTKLTSEEKEEAKEKKKEKEKRKLPELEKYWNAVNDDPADFTGWTYLLQYVDQENDIEAAREAYDAFLAHYPYCYGYWRKYADYEKRKGNKKKCEEVFERGLKAIPLSVDLWIHYLTHVKTNFVDNEEYVRSQFERALSACGLEFRSDKLWEAFIKWEMEAKRYSKVLKIYDRLLKTPTQGYSGHFDSFQDLINNQSISSIISVEEFKKIRSEIRESEKTGDKEITVDEEDEADDHVRNDEEATAIKDKIIALRRKVHKATVSAVTARWTFEEGIKRPYFHVKPLERCQLKNWNEYLDYEIERGDRKRVLILFERCLIACALYDEFWLKLIRYLELQKDLDLIPATRDAFDRACTIHHPDKPSLHLMWSAFEECQNNFNKAAEILVNVEKIAPNLLQIAYRRINLERRRGDFEKCKELYEYYISQAKNKNIAGSLAIKYARFCHKIMEDLEAGLNVLRLTLEKDPANTRVALQMIDLALQRHQVNEEEVVEIMDKFMSRDGMEPDQKVLFAQRKVEFLEDFGSTAKGLQDAQRALHIALNKANESKKKSESSPSKKSTSKDTTPPASVSNSATSAYNNGSYGYGSSTNSNYYGNNQSYPSYDSYGYNHWQQQYGTGYSGGYSQWSGYGNYY